ncbi:heme oxygenase [Bacillus sp. AGMB 02131]|uniref:Heme oxygenase n=1 Tax=Peribacillus faecalis TaxID=2772559 RepID=A0A927CU03_9BACI|nr:heme oxygenase [Peribacillus faecalis]MBD3107006.1 heme oxygenase [Peribacillus faecalis]
MIIVTNRIKTKVGFAEKMAPGFVRPSSLLEFEGFIKVEVAVTQGLTEYDELNVNMFWDNVESFNAWRNSDSFRDAHKRPEPGSEAEKQEKENSPILGSEIIIQNIVATTEALPAK